MATSTFTKADGTEAEFHSLPSMQASWGVDLASLPYTIRVLLEAALRKCDGFLVTEADVARIANWTPDMTPEVGMNLVSETPDGTQIPLVITEVNDATIKVDANHPLAGKDLVFDIQLVEIV